LCTEGLGSAGSSGGLSSSLVVRPTMAAGGVCDITPVEGVTVSVRGGAQNSFEVEWRDMRCLPTSSDADVSRNATPRAFLDSTRSVHGLVAILHKIVFGECQDDTGKAAESGAAAADAAAAAGRELTICLQRRRGRAVMRRVAVTPDSSGQAMTVTVYNGAKVTVMRQVAPWGFLAQLSEMCSGDDGFVLVRETCWYAPCLLRNEPHCRGLFPAAAAGMQLANHFADRVAGVLHFACL